MEKTVTTTRSSTALCTKRVSRASKSRTRVASSPPAVPANTPTPPTYQPLVGRSEIWGNMGVVVGGADGGTRRCPYLVLDAHEYEINVARNLEGFNGTHVPQPTVAQLEHAFSMVSLFSAGFFNFILDALPRFVAAQTSGVLPLETVVIVRASNLIMALSTSPA